MSVMWYLRFIHWHYWRLGSFVMLRYVYLHVVRGVSKRERAQNGRWPLAASAFKMTYLYPVTSDTTEKGNKICNVLGPLAPLPDRRAPVVCTGFPSLIGTSWDWFVDCVLWGFSVSALDVVGPCCMIYSRCWTRKDSMWTWQDKHLKRLWKIGQRKSKTRLTFHGKILLHIC
jgi:hypothetical protein